MAPGTIYCCIPSCISSRSRNLLNTTVIQDNREAITFHKFPKNPKRYSLWVVQCFGSNCPDQWLGIVSGNKLPYICSKHFTPDDFSETYALGDSLQFTKKRNLKVHAVPSLNLDSSPREAQITVVNKTYPKRVKPDPNQQQIEYIAAPSTKTDSISEKLRQLREEGKRRIAQLIKENEDIYKCPVHKINSPSCSIEKCVLRTRQRVTKSTEVSSEDGSFGPQFIEIINSNEFYEKCTNSYSEVIEIKPETIINREDHSPENLDSKSFALGENIVLNFVADSGPTGAFLPTTVSIPQYLLDKNPSIHIDEDGNYRFSINGFLSSEDGLEFSNVEQTDQSSFANGGDGSDEESKIQVPSKVTRKVGLLRQPGLEASETSFEVIEAPEDSEETEDNCNSPETKISAPTHIAKVTQLGSEKCPLVPKKIPLLKKIRKIERLISENNLLISKLPTVLDSRGNRLKRKLGRGAEIGGEKLRRCQAVDEDEEVQGTNKENNECPLLSPLRSSSLNHCSVHEAKIVEQNNLIQKLLEKNQALTKENERLQEVERENKYLKLQLKDELKVDCDKATIVGCDSSTESCPNLEEIVEFSTEEVQRYESLKDSWTCSGIKSSRTGELHRTSQLHKIGELNKVSDLPESAVEVEYLDENSFAISEEEVEIEKDVDLVSDDSVKEVESSAIDSGQTLRTENTLNAKGPQEIVVMESSGQLSCKRMKFSRKDFQFEVVEPQREIDVAAGHHLILS